MQKRASKIPLLIPGLAFWITWQRLSQDLAYWRRLGRQLHTMYVAIAQRAQQAKAMPDTQVLPPLGVQPAPAPLPKGHWPQWTVM